MIKKTFIFYILVLVPLNLWGAYITQDTVGGCGYDYMIIDNNNHSDIFAEFTVNEHTCANGEFLPANIDECRSCPTGGVCPGGTYNFNKNVSQGISVGQIFTQSLSNSCVKDLIGIDTNNHSIYFARFTPNTHTCSGGYYLPANIDECIICPINNYCVGGTYTFNETTDQGIQSCASGTFSPTGSAVCYPHIMHVGDSNIYLKSTKQTTPSFNVTIGNNTFYANMTTVPTKMNKDSSRYFRAQWDNNSYYICDDTTCGE